MNPKDDLKLKKDDGLARRVKACRFSNGYVDCANAQAAEELQRQWCRCGASTTQAPLRFFRACMGIWCKASLFHAHFAWPC